MKLVAQLRALCAAAMLLTLLGCAAAAPPTTRPPSPTPARPAASPTSQPAGAEGLCAIFTEDLAVAALGEAVDDPSQGDVLPRPNGIYCHYAAAANANTNVEAQVKDMTRDDFEASEGRIDETRPLSGVGEAAFQRDSSIMGLSGAFVAAWAGGRGVTVTINREGGNQAAMNAAAQAIAAKVLLTP